MIESFEDLGLNELSQDDENFWTLFDERLKEKLGLTSVEIKAALSEAIIKKAEELSLELPNIAPYGDYTKLLEDNDSMTEFLKKEASKTDNLRIISVNQDEKQKQLLKFALACSAVDDNALAGYVYVSLAGVIRHAFAQAEV